MKIEDWNAVILQHSLTENGTEAKRILNYLIIANQKHINSNILTIYLHT